MDVFISYSSQNKPYADKLADALRRRGFDVWRDRDALENGVHVVCGTYEWLGDLASLSFGS
jgi:hypothetical protein